VSDPPQSSTVTPPEGVIAPALRVVADCEEAVIYRHAQRFLVRTLAGISALFGLSLLVGGQARFGTPTLTYAAAMPGSFRTWGAAALAMGVFTYAASFHWHRRAVMWGLLAQCVVFAFFTVTIAVSAVQDPTTPFTGIVIYGGYSVICTLAYGAGHELRRTRA
jgi:uncharacterized membrane protein HdeD (DUF308 family)